MRAQRALAVDAVENLIAAYTYYLDACMTADAEGLFQSTGNALPATANALATTGCEETGQDARMTLRHVTRPEIAVGSDGQSARYSARIWEVRAADGAADTYRGAWLTGMARYANGRWQLVELASVYDWTATAPGG